MVTWHAGAIQIAGGWAAVRVAGIHVNILLQPSRARPITRPVVLSSRSNQAGSAQRAESLRNEGRTKGAKLKESPRGPRLRGRCVISEPRMRYTSFTDFLTRIIDDDQARRRCVSC